MTFIYVFLGMSVGLAAFIFGITMIVRRTMRKDKTQGWAVAVTPATRKSWDYEGSSATPVEGVIAIRLTLDGKFKMTYGTIKINDPDFGEMIATMKAEALERASDLTAAGAR